MAAVWLDTWVMACPNYDEKARRAWAAARGAITERLVGSVHGEGWHWCIHATTGLEVLAAEEVAATAGCSEVHAMVGRVIFSSDASAQTLRQTLRSALLLSYLVLASPACATWTHTPTVVHFDSVEQKSDA